MKGRALLCAITTLGLTLGAPETSFAAEHLVAIEKYTFSPTELHVRKGDTVTWLNNEKRVSHSVLFMGSGEESERFFPGEKWSRVFPEAGRFEYRCGPHPEMLGVVIVAD
ncbi:plastocyanin/azurin family copper-binding protein [Thauera sp. JM12B12]|uniref:plastocyanin/azurin family copper-binding protein n=1 Tax=Thauera sp. JM12B12 TaxID=3142262 RepID=UPI0031F44981